MLRTTPQVEHLFRVLDLPKLDTFSRDPHPDLSVPYHIPPFTKATQVSVPVGETYARILGQGLVPLTRTPHFGFLTGDITAYRTYFETHMGKTLTDDHSAGAFGDLNAGFREDYQDAKGRPCPILAQPLVLPDGRQAHMLMDGVHRASILAHRGQTHVTLTVPVDIPVIQSASVSAGTSDPTSEPTSLKSSATVILPDEAKKLAVAG